MPVSAAVLRVLIASPGDMIEARDAVERALARWNGVHGERSGYFLQPVRWETDSVPLLGADPQAILNKQLVDKSDIVVALFGSRLGLATPRAVSGTADEMETAFQSGKPVHTWFYEGPHPSDVDTAQLEALRAFKSELGKRGLYRAFKTTDELSWAVWHVVEYDISSVFAQSDPPDEEPPAAAARQTSHIGPPSPTSDGAPSAAAPRRTTPRSTATVKPKVSPPRVTEPASDQAGDVAADHGISVRLEARSTSATGQVGELSLTNLTGDPLTRLQVSGTGGVTLEAQANRGYVNGDSITKYSYRRVSNDLGVVLVSWERNSLREQAAFVINPQNGSPTLAQFASSAYPSALLPALGYVGPGDLLIENHCGAPMRHVVVMAQQHDGRASNVIGTSSTIQDGVRGAVALSERSISGVLELGYTVRDQRYRLLIKRPHLRFEIE